MNVVSMASENQSSELNEDTGPVEFTQPQGRRPSAPRPSGVGGGLACALVGLIVLVVIVLIGVALFLPPFSIGDRLFGTPYSALNGQSPSTSQGGLTVAVSTADATSGLSVRFRSIAPAVLTGQTAPNSDDAAWVRAAHNALPATLKLVSPIYKIDQKAAVP